MSWGNIGDSGGPFTESLGKLRLLPPTCLGAQLGALPQPLRGRGSGPCLVLASITWRWLSDFLLQLCLLSFSF